MAISTPYNPKLIKDLTGQRFGRLIVDQISIRRGASYNTKHQVYWLCVCDCGNIKRALGRDLTRGMTKSCGCLHSETSRATGLRRGPAKGNWKHGLNSSGYPSSYVDGKHKLGHRVVMEELIGRPLLPEETVHHKNGIRTDNRPENLELWSTKHPRGARVEDKVAWAIELLRLYAPERLS